MSVFARFFGLLLSISASISGIASVAQAQSESFTVQPIIVALPMASQVEDGEGCKTEIELRDQTAKAYAGLLADRFNTTVTLCFTETLAESAAMAERGEVNFAWVDQDGAATVADNWRPVLTLRNENGLGRVPFVLFALKGGQAETILGGLTANDAGLMIRPPQSLNIDEAKRLLRDYSVLYEDGDQPRTYPDQWELIKAVENGEVQTGILEGGTWGRACGVLDPASTFCDHLEVLIYDRPRAPYGFIIPTETSKERHYRLVGLHIAIHLEAPEIHDWLRQGHGFEFEPTEATAMAPKSIDNAVAF